PGQPGGAAAGWAPRARGRVSSVDRSCSPPPVPSVKTFTQCQGQTPQAQPSARCLYPASDHPPVTGAVVLDPGVVSTPLVDEESSSATRTVTTTPTSTITPTTAKTTTMIMQPSSGRRRLRCLKFAMP